MDEDKIYFINEELEEKRKDYDNTLKAITGITLALEAVNELAEEITPGIYGHLDGDLAILEDTKISLELQIEKLEEEQNYTKNNPMWKQERKEENEHYWKSQF